MNSDKVVCGCGRTLTRVGLARHKCNLKPVEFKCDFCDREFTTEKRLLNHMCEGKRRHQQRDDRAVKLGFMAFEHFYKRSMNRVPNYDTFANSSLYGAFVRFGRHLIELDAVNPLGFIDFLLRIESPVDRWTDLRLYNTFIKELTKNEPPLDAIDRNLRLMQQWSAEYNEDWHDFFRRVAPPLAVLWITNGRLSPWLLFTASSARELMERMNAEQAAMVEKIIDPDFWGLKLARHQADVDTIRVMLEQFGI